MEKLDHRLSIVPLVMEDILNTRQRPKMEDFEEYIYIVFKMLTYDSQTEQMNSEQISLIVEN